MASGTPAPWADGSAPVRISVPATPEHIGLVRLLASGLASRLGFGVDRIDDVRLAVDELCFAAATDAPTGTVLEVAFAATPQGISVEGLARVPDGAADQGPPARSALAGRILASLTDEHHLDGRGFRATVVGRSSSGSS